MKDYFKGKCVLITGASSGIGADLAVYLSELGANLILWARRTSKLEAIKEKCASNVTIIISKVDVTSISDIEEALQELYIKFSFVDIVIANAGIGGLNPADNFSLDINSKILRVNVEGTVNTFSPFIKKMIEQKKGHLVGVSSLASFRGLPNASSYSASKAAQARILESFRVDLKKYGISVTSIFPGFVKSEMTEHNDFPMPFKMSERCSSKIIAKSICKKKAVVAYPFLMKILTLINRSLPPFIYDFVMGNISKKQKNIEAKIF